MERRQALVSVIGSGAAGSNADMRAMAERIVALGDRAAQDGTWSMLFTRWSSRSPEDAMEWALQNAARMPRGVFRQLGESVGVRDPSAAAAYTAQIPANERGDWIRGVATGFAANDARGAAEWLGQFRGEPGYATAVLEIAERIARQDAVAALHLVEEVESGVGAQRLNRTASMIVNNWANQDPRAAAEWALDRPDQNARASFVSSVLHTWAANDLADARQWALGLRQGQSRDMSLTTLLRATTPNGSGTLDIALLNGFSSKEAEQSAVLQVV
jgi:hypothetical protein